MDMRLYEFNALIDFEKGEALFNHGEHITERFDEKYGYSLYQLNHFYVEVVYNGGINAITKFTSFSTYTKLEPYIQKIDISRMMIVKNSACCFFVACIKLSLCKAIINYSVVKDGIGQMFT